MAKTEGRQFAVRLDGDELEALDRLRRVAKVETLSDAMRLAIRLAPAGMVSKIVEDVERIREQLGLLNVELDATQPNAMGGYADDQLVAWAQSRPSAIRDMAERELIRRGFMPNATGSSWVPGGTPRQSDGRSAPSYTREAAEARIGKKFSR